MFNRENQFNNSDREDQIINEKEKTIQVIMDFINTDLNQKFPRGIVDQLDEEKRTSLEERYEYLNVALKEYFQNKSFVEMEEILEGEIDFIQNAIFIYSEKMKEIEEINEKIDKLIEIGGIKMVPFKIRNVYQLPEQILEFFYNMIRNEKLDQANKRVILIHKTGIEEIEKDILPELIERKPIQIENLERFDYSDLKAKDVILQALQFIPQKLIGKNILKINYEDKIRPMSEKYGIEGSTSAAYSAFEKLITFYKPNIKKRIASNAILRAIFYRDLPKNLRHEAGHALDPRLIYQENLSLTEEVEMVLDLEEVRNKEEEFSSYVLEIKNEDKQVENLLKSQESLAETIGMFFINPSSLEKNYPQRFELCKKWLNKQFPEENFTDFSRASNLNTQYINIFKKTKK